MDIKIDQPAGLGDIFYCLKIADYYLKKGDKVYWPVIKQYSWIRDYIKLNNLFWEDISNPHKIIDIKSGGHFFPSIPIMEAKYAVAELNSSDWLTFFNFNRNPEKENLIYETEVEINKPYCLICDTFASPPGSIKRVIPEHGSLFNIRIRGIENFVPFDWCKIIENANELRFVDTCFTYIVEKLNIKATKLQLYSRDGNFYTNHIWKKPWEYIL